jgi:hypothetical protein
LNRKALIPLSKRYFCLGRCKTLVRCSYLEEVQSFLKSKCEEATVVVMPDFFLDRFVSLNCECGGFLRKGSQNVAGRKGGSIDGIVQKEFREETP